MSAEEAPWLEMVGGYPVLTTERLELRLAEPGEEPKIARYLERNREHLRPWEPLRDDRYFLEEAWQGAPERDRQEALAGLAYRFRVLLRGPNLVSELPLNEYAGTISLRGIVPFPGYNATLGYSLDRSCEGRGLMREAVASVVRFAFERLNLRRLEACFMPSNVRSEKLLLALGFQVEGLLRSSLEVDGKWEDHKICSLINTAWRRP